METATWREWNLCGFIRFVILSRLQRAICTEMVLKIQRTTRRILYFWHIAQRHIFFFQVHREKGAGCMIIIMNHVSQHLTLKNRIPGTIQSKDLYHDGTWNAAQSKAHLFMPMNPPIEGFEDYNWMPPTNVTTAFICVNDSYTLKPPIEKGASVVTECTL